MFAWRDNYISFNGAANDPYWTSVSLLNSYENNLGFIDSSTNNFVVTPVNSARTNSRTPFSTGSSFYFNVATSDHILLPAGQTAFTLGTGAFTIEFWTYVSAISGNQCFVDMRFSAIGDLGIVIYLNGNTLTFFTGSAARITSVGAVTAGAWTHIALARSGTSTKLFVNGTQVGSTYTDSNSYIANTPYISRFYETSGGSGSITGFMTNVRIVKGTAVYTSNFTPSTVPLTAISGTSILLLATSQGITNNSQFVDTGPYPFTVSPTNTPLYSGLSPFTNTYPGSISLLSANAQSLTVATNAAFTYAAGDFTIECWVRFRTAGTQQFIIDQRNSSTATAIIPTIYRDATNVIVYFVNGSARITGTATIVIDTWYHIAVARSGTDTKLFVNGTQDGSTYSDSNSYAASRVVIGTNAASAANYLNGYVSNVRLSKGFAYYTTTFVPSTTPLTSSTTYTSLLLTAQEGGFYDLSNSGQLMTNTSTNAVVSVQQAKFSTQSVSFTPTGYLTVSNATNLQLGTGDFTVEGYFNRNATGAIHTILSKGATTPTGWMLQVSTTSPYNSLSFNGTSQFAYVKPSGATSGEFNLGTGNFTIELWVYPTKAASNIYAPTIFTINSNGDWAAGSTGCRLSTQTLILGGASFTQITFSTAIPLNAWTFVSIVRNGSGAGNVVVYHNGVSKGTGTFTGSVGSNTAWPAIGASDSAPTGREFMSGYFTDWRIVKGVAVRTGAFSPPTVPLTAISGTSVLVFQSYVDTGPNVLTIFTTGSPGVFSITPYGSSTDTLKWTSSSTTIVTSTTTIAASTWYYFAVVRTGTTVYLFINGTLEATGTDSTNYNQTNNLFIGCDRSNLNGFNGYLDNIRITTGVARYTATYSPPTTVFPTSP